MTDNTPFEELCITLSNVVMTLLVIACVVGWVIMFVCWFGWWGIPIAIISPILAFMVIVGIGIQGPTDQGY